MYIYIYIYTYIYICIYIYIYTYINIYFPQKSPIYNTGVFPGKSHSKQNMGVGDEKNNYRVPKRQLQ